MPKRTFANRYALDMLIQQQDGIISYRQLRELGLPPGTLAHLTRTGGRWQRILYGVYLAFTGPPQWRHRVKAALLYSGPGAIVTGMTALRLYGFQDPSASDEVHVLIPHDRRRISRGFLRIERTSRLPQANGIGDVPCAPIARAVADACRFVRRKNTVRAIVAEAVRNERCTLAELWIELKNGSRRGSALFREALVEVYEGIRSAFEGEVRDFFCKFGLPEPLWNVALYTRDGIFLGVVDGYLEEYGIVLEANSMEYHFALMAWEATQKRQGRLAAHRLIIVPITSNRLHTDPAGLADDFWTAIRQADGRPRPGVVIGPHPRSHRHPAAGP